MQTLSFALLTVSALAGISSARPQFQQIGAGGVAAATPVPILLNERTPIDTLGGYGFRIQTGNGIVWNESAAASGPLAQVVRNGDYSFTHPDGTPHQMSYVADGAGFRAVSNMIPTPYPLLPWQLEQVRFAEEQRRLQAQSAAASATQG